MLGSVIRTHIEEILYFPTHHNTMFSYHVRFSLHDFPGMFREEL